MSGRDGRNWIFQIKKNVPESFQSLWHLLSPTFAHTVLSPTFPLLPPPSWSIIPSSFKAQAPAFISPPADGHLPLHFHDICCNVIWQKKKIHQIPVLYVQLFYLQSGCKAINIWDEVFFFLLTIPDTQLVEYGI